MDYGEIFLESMQTLIDKGIEQIQMDETVICTIEDISERSNGKYTVSSKDTSTFEAYSEDTTYRLKDQVYVLVPRDDTMQRLILSKYITEEAQPISYVSLGEKIVPMSSDLTMLGTNNYRLAPNGGEADEQRYIELKNITNYDKLYESSIHDTVYLKAEFKCPLNGYTITQGNYGLLLVFKNTEEILTMTLDSSDMFGNPFSFGGYFLQEKIFNYKADNDFTDLELYFYQDNNFKYRDSETGQILDLDASVVNIEVKNIEVFFGYNAENVEDDTVKIFTSSDTLYGTGNMSKAISLVWYNKDKDNRYLGFTDGQFLSRDKAMETKDASSTDTNNYYWIDWMVDNKTGTLEKISDGGASAKKYTMTCLDVLTNTRVQAYVWLNGTAYKSNILTFENQRLKSDRVSHDNITLELEHGEYSQDLYSLYGENNALVDNSQAYRDRKIKLKWSSNEGVVNDVYWENATVYWYLPKNATMLVPTNTTGDISTDQDTDYIFQTRLGSQGFLGEDQKTFTYRIKNIYQRNFVNNIIKCAIELPNGAGRAEASIKFTFASSGNSGTTYTLAVTPVGRAFGKEEKDAVVDDFQASLTDASGNSLTETASFSWEKYPVTQGNIAQNGSIAHFAFDTTSYNVLKVSTQQEWAGMDINLDTLYAVEYSKEGKYYSSAMNHIFYNSFGKLINTDFPELELFELDTNKKVSNVNWRIEYRTDNSSTTNAIPTSSTILSWLPQMDETKNSIKPAMMYSSDLNYYCVLIAEKGGEIVYTTPLIIEQYQYGSSLLNNWDGSLQIDEENNTILAAMMGAGIKNDDNTFSGVVMGQLQKVDSGVKSDITGLIGYHHGAQSFGFKDDGTAFIGGSGAGRIEFDGNVGIISSPGWTYTKTKDSNGIVTGYSKYTNSIEKGSLWNLANGDLILQKDDEHFKFTDSGLDIQVNSLSITGGIGGTNLLKNTRPVDKDTTLSVLPWYASTNVKSISVYDGSIDDTACFKVEYQQKDKNSDNSLKQHFYIKQAVKLKSNKKYTISAKIHPGKNSNRMCFICHPPSLSKAVSGDIIVKPGETKHTSITFTTGTVADTDNTIYIGCSLYNDNDEQERDTTEDTSKKNFYITDIKLEEGAIFSTWSPHPDDYYDYIDGISYLNQDNVFNKLTNNGTIKGIWKDGNELYINATQIGTGILRSNNWNGTYTAQEDANHKWKYTITNAGTKGAYLNLNEGFFSMKQDNGQYITFDSTGLSIKANKFYFSTGDDVKSYIDIQDNKIELAVIQQANYKCTCGSAASNTNKYIKLSDADHATLKKTIPSGQTQVNLKAGATFVVTFSNANTNDAPLFRLCDKNGNNVIFEANLSPNVKWEANETLAFVYDGDNFVMTSISSSKITQTANSITSEVRRTAGYAATSTSAKNSTTYDITLVNAGNLTSTDIHMPGVTLAVTFTNEQAEKKEVKLKVLNTTNTIYCKNSKTSASNPFTWKANDTIYFSYTGSGWQVVDSGAYSKIQQLADSISLKVTGSAGGTASIVVGVDGKEQTGYIDLTGAVTFNDLKSNSKTVINGSYITTGTIKDENNNFNLNLSTGVLSAKKLTITGGSSADSWKNGYLTLNSNPSKDSDYYFGVGNNKNYILFKKNGTFQLKAGGLSFDGTTLTIPQVDTSNFVTKTGTFSGTLSGVDGTFSGKLVSATGLFKGTVSSTYAHLNYIILNDPNATGTNLYLKVYADGGTLKTTATNSQ